MSGPKEHSSLERVREIDRLAEVMRSGLRTFTTKEARKYILSNMLLLG
jgi:hypothetical protein